MPAPVVGDWALELYSRLDPLTDQDAALGWPLLAYCGAIGDTFFEEINDLVRDRGGQPGWAAAMDPDQATTSGLAWLGQFAGVRLRSEDDTQAKDVAWVKATAGFSRGSPAAMIAAIQPLLTGTKHVVLNERLGGNAYALEVQLILAEIPAGQKTKVAAAALGQKPAGIIMTFNPTLTQTWLQMRTANATWTIARSTYANFDLMKMG